MQEYLFSDAHGDADAVWEVIRNTGDGRVYCLGDFADFWCPDTDCVVDLVWQHCDVVMPGNHDLELGKWLRRDYNPCSWESAFAHSLEEITKQRLLELDAGPRIWREQGKVFQHSWPQSTFARYTLNVDDAEEYFHRYGISHGTVAFVGHSHIPQLYRKGKRGVYGGQVLKAETFYLADDESALVVLPSAAMPRNGFGKGFVAFDPLERQVEFVNIKV